MKRWIVFAGYEYGKTCGCENLLPDSFDDHDSAIRFIIEKTKQKHPFDWFHLFDRVTGVWFDGDWDSIVMDAEDEN